ncbi:hypothetical protein TanjilG_32901 [Lupinus angustifolius]|uniref:Uncharacterized protein n=1 Tax=Lupinus angustifolius TaxID=3871 RepID=A0A4P1RPZ5_LUPAN|nr:hypothetical protein TanjilG_32901 [Lupinus angustifolius]
MLALFSLVESRTLFCPRLECFIERSHEKTYVSRWNWPITKGDVRRVRAWLDSVFSPGRVGGEDWQSSSFSGGLIGSDSPSVGCPTAHKIPINNLEVWLSGLRHWFAKSTYNKIVSWVRIPFPSAQKWNGRAKLRDRKNLLVLVQSLGGQNSTT